MPARWRSITGYGAATIAAVSLFAVGVASGGDWRWAGSAQLDYLAVPTNSAPRSTTFDGFTTELSLKIAVDVNDRVAAESKLCYSCHGVEVGMALADFTLTEQLKLRVGRFTPRFGDFPRRHDPANHRTSDKPLPYDMGRMLRLREWNMSVLPAPYVDNGVELVGNHRITDGFDVDWAAYLIGGLKGSQGATDVDFIQSRSGEWYYVDNNSQPSAGARLAAHWRGEGVAVSLGASALGGNYDPEAKRDYLMLGADLTVSIRRVKLRAEYLLRRQRMSLGANPETRFVYGPGALGVYDPYMIKDGFYVEAEVPFGDWEAIARWDGMTRVGNVTTTSPLDDRSWVLRYTAAVAWRVQRRVRAKLSFEYYQFSDFPTELAIHIGTVTTF